MSALIVPVLLFVLADASATETLFAPAAPPAALELPVKNSSGIGRFEFRDGSQSNAWLATQFRETLWHQSNHLRALNKQPPQSQEEYERSTEFSTAKRMLEIRRTWQTGSSKHTWVFNEPDAQGGIMERALELEDFSGPDGYFVRATVHCYDVPERCKDFRDRQTALLAPKPVSTAGDLAVRQWRNRVNAEACTVFAKNIQQPQYPILAMRDGVQGSVLVGIVFNTCGNVRDAWIQQSSGNLELDRAAQSQAMKWQIDMKLLPNAELEPGRALVSVRFLLDDETAEATNAAFEK